MKAKVLNQLRLLSSGNSTGPYNSVSVVQRDTVDVERDELTKHVRIVVQVPRVAQHRSLRHDTVEQWSFVFVKPHQVLDSVTGFKVESVELEAREVENVSIRHDALRRDRLR